MERNCTTNGHTVLPEIRWLSAFALAAALLFGASPFCSSAERPIRACALLSSREAGAILGRAITVHPVDTSAAGPGAASMCRYSADGLHAGFVLLAARLQVDDLPKEVAGEKAEVREEAKQDMHTVAKIEDVPGVGDAAFLVKTENSFQIHAFTKNAKVAIMRNIRANAEAVSQSERLARVAVSHLR